MSERPAPAWRPTLKRRIALAAGALALWGVGIEARLIYLQVVRHEALSLRAERQQSDMRSVPARRGEILDRRGHVLAVSLDVQTISAKPREIDDPAAAVTRVCAALADCTPADRATLLERLTSSKAFVYVRRLATPDQAHRVAALGIKGIQFHADIRRFYPNRELAAHLLGYVNIDHNGLSGIEAAYDSLVRGRAGHVLVHKDAKQTVFRHQVEKAPTVGASLELTVDEYVQYVVERELRAGVEENRATSGSAVVIDPWTGEILALANYPTFNPNNVKDPKPALWRNRAVQEVYEPGSTFKIVTASAALEQEVVEAGDVIDVSGGKIRFGADVIHDTHDYKALSFADVIVKSSNVGAIKVALRLGPDKLGDYIQRFGFGRPLSPRDFPGEAHGIVWKPSALTDRALARVSMGYQVAVTPLQMAAAVGAVANGGELIQPRIIRAVIRNGVRRTVPRTVLGRAIEPGTAASITAIMEAVVERGTATLAQIPGYTVAGKTGTAAKVVNRRYSKTEYNASFVGFVPSRKPVYAIVVVIDSPRGANGYYGGPVTAPVFRRIAESLLLYGAVPPTLNAPPPVLVHRLGAGARERPASGPTVSPRLLPRSPDGTLPDFTGLSARDAINTIAQLGMTPKLHGTGVVTTQRPAGGTAYETGGVVSLWLTRRPKPHEPVEATLE